MYILCRTWRRSPWIYYEKCLAWWFVKLSNTIKVQWYINDIFASIVMMDTRHYFHLICYRNRHWVHYNMIINTMKKQQQNDEYTNAKQAHKRFRVGANYIPHNRLITANYKPTPLYVSSYKTSKVHQLLHLCLLPLTYDHRRRSCNFIINWSRFRQTQWLHIHCHICDNKIPCWLCGVIPNGRTSAQYDIFTSSTFSKLPRSILPCIFSL